MSRGGKQKWECIPANASINLRSAAKMLEPYVSEVRASFLRAGLDKIASCRVEVSEKAHDGGRHFAACRTDGCLLMISPHMVHLPEATAMGIIAHEFGHAADFLYPGRWSPSKSGMVLTPAGRTSNDGVPTRILKEWRCRNDDVVERAADSIAETVLGVKIGYAGPCLLQTIGSGQRPRPQGLR